MLIIIIKHCSCHIQGKYVVVGHFWNPCIGQAESGKLDLIVLIDSAEEKAALHTLHHDKANN
jgi:hypothetical protein